MEYVVRGTALSLFRSYLTNRHQFVSLSNGVKSASKVIKHGVPQGSVLGLSLFLIFINELYAAILYSGIYHFVASTSIKYLGVLLDADLSWKSQINNVAAKSSRGLMEP